MGTINERLSQVAGYYKLKTYSAFAERTGLSHQMASSYLKGMQKPGADALAKIKESSDGTNSEWLLTGKGPMLKQEPKTVEEAPTPFQTNVKPFKAPSGELDVEKLAIYVSKHVKELEQNHIFMNYVNRKAYEIALDIVAKKFLK